MSGRDEELSGDVRKLMTGHCCDQMGCPFEVGEARWHCSIHKEFSAVAVPDMAYLCVLLKVELMQVGSHHNKTTFGAFAYRPTRCASSATGPTLVPPGLDVAYASRL